MKKIIYLLLIFLLQISFVNGQGNDPEKKLNSAIYEEEINGNLQEAIVLYEEIVKKFPKDRSVVAEALYRNGLANEKLGNLKAMQYYEKVINNYADQPELVKLAQTRLNRMLKTEKPTESQLASLRLFELNKEDDNSLSVINLYKEGSWLEGSTLSPDGTKMAGIEYSIGQNVNVYDRVTEKTQMITKYKWASEPYGITYDPIWSPDGKEIVYSFTNTPGIWELQVSTLQGKTRSLIKNINNAGKIIPRQWSQDGSSILTFKQDSTGYYTIGLVVVKEGSFKALHKTKWKDRFIDGCASLSPDGKYVVFADETTDNFDLFIIDTKGGAPVLLSGYPTNEYEPLWSPDGKHIVFIRETKGESILYALEMQKGKPIGHPFLIKQGMKNVELINWTKSGISYDFSLDLNEIYTLPLNNKTGVPLGVPKLIDYDSTGSNICPVWSHDGKHLAFISFDGKPNVVVKTGSGKTKHYNIPTDDFWERAIHDLRWLPDNSGVGFNHINKSNISYVFRLDLATGDWNKWLLPLDGGWTRIDWGPDKNTFVYNKPNIGFYQFDVRNGESKKIYHPDNSEAWYVSRGLKFSRDHKKLTFMFQNSNKIKNLMVYDLESGKSKTLTQDYWQPTFSPDGNKILTFGKKKSVAILSLEGEVLQQYDLTKHFETSTRMHSPDWSPDGKQLVFSTRYLKYDTYLMKNVLK